MFQTHSKINEAGKNDKQKDIAGPRTKVVISVLEADQTCKGVSRFEGCPKRLEQTWFSPGPLVLVQES